LLKKLKLGTWNAVLLTKEVNSVRKKSKMSIQVKSYVDPMRLVLYSPLCQYCGVADKGWFRIYDKYGILWCDLHKSLAERDGRAWLCRNDKVAWKDATADPLFVAGGLLDCDISVRRSSGAIETKGWRLSKPSFDDPAFVNKDEKGWWMYALNTDTQVGRGVRIEDLKLSLSEDKWGLVDAFISRLNNGFYTAEFDAYEQAKMEWQRVAADAENPGASGIGAKLADSGIQAVFHPKLGLGRVVIVPEIKAALDQLKDGDPLP